MTYSMAFQSIRRPVAFVLAHAVGFLLFYLMPWQLMVLNERLGWLRFQNPIVGTIGILLIVAGIILFGICLTIFFTVGEGTPHPLDPPIHLVEEGPYRFSRNPIYVSFIAFLLGVFLKDGRITLLLYTGIMWIAFHLYVVFWEEPVLRRRYGIEYENYVQRVPRWFLIRPARTKAGS